MSKFVIAIFGASGDLTKRKLIPAIYTLFKANRLPKDFSILGISRTPYSDESFRAHILKNSIPFIHSTDQDRELILSFVKHIYYLTMDPALANDYTLLNNRLIDLAESNTVEDILFYLATPPSLYGVIPTNLQKAGLNSKKSRIIVEKPFGYDLESAKALNTIYTSVFHEDQIFRIDHFLGKETVQNLLVFRFANSIFETLWNRNYIQYIEITGVENLGIENRGGYYDSTGAVRDMVQNHLIQLAALIAMEPPVSFHVESFRNEIVKVYESLVPFKKNDFINHIIRGQYTGSDNTVGYREEINIASDSRTETYTALKFSINNWRWNGVPFFIRTGKQMPTKVTEIVIHFRKIPHQMFLSTEKNHPVTNRLVLRIQPNEGISLEFCMKVPGSGIKTKPVMMDFDYSSLSENLVGDAYVRLIEDCIKADSTFFMRSDAVEASWRFFDPILQYWKKHPETPLYGYTAGSWGPPASEKMVRRYGGKWTNPCKNRTNRNLFCEL